MIHDAIARIRWSLQAEGELSSTPFAEVRPSNIFFIYKSSNNFFDCSLMTTMFTNTHSARSQKMVARPISAVTGALLAYFWRTFVAQMNRALDSAVKKRENKPRASAQNSIKCVQSVQTGAFIVSSHKFLSVQDFYERRSCAHTKSSHFLHSPFSLSFY